MTKVEIIEQLVEKAGLQKRDAEKALESTIAIVQGAMKQGEKVILSGLGSFVVVEKAARTARNPKTGEAVQVPARKAVKFKPGKELKDLMK